MLDACQSDTAVGKEALSVSSLQVAVLGDRKQKIKIYEVLIPTLEKEKEGHLPECSPV